MQTLNRTDRLQMDTGIVYDADTGRAEDSPTLQAMRHAPYRLHATPPRLDAMEYQFTPIVPAAPHVFSPSASPYQFPYVSTPTTPVRSPFGYQNPTTPGFQYSLGSRFTPARPFASTSATYNDDRGESPGLESRRRSSGYSTGKGSSLFDSLPTIESSHTDYSSAASSTLTRRSSTVPGSSDDFFMPEISFRDSRRRSDPTQDRHRSTSTTRRSSAPIPTVSRSTTGGAVVVSNDFPEQISKAGVTPFIAKLHAALEREDVFGDCLRWSADGRRFLLDLG